MSLQALAFSRRGKKSNGDGQTVPGKSEAPSHIHVQGKNIFSNSETCEIPACRCRDIFIPRRWTNVCLDCKCAGRSSRSEPLCGPPPRTSPLLFVFIHGLYIKHNQCQSLAVDAGSVFAPPPPPYAELGRERLSKPRVFPSGSRRVKDVG